MIYTRIAFIWPWVGPKASNILNMGTWEGIWWVPGIALPGPTRPHYPGYTPSRPTASVHLGARVSGLEYGRGAHIRRPTHLSRVILRVPRYDRGI